MTQVLAQPLGQQGGHLDLAYDGIAASTQKSAHVSSGVAVIHNEIPIGGVAEQAASVLYFSHLLDIVGGQAIFAHEASAQVLLSRSPRVSSTPFAQPFVSALPVCLSVLTVASTHTGPAFHALQSPLRELGVGQGLGAEATRRHYAIMPCDTSTQLSDQPCHADVLLGLANQPVAAL